MSEPICKEAREAARKFAETAHMKRETLAEIIQSACLAHTERVTAELCKAHAAQLWEVTAKLADAESKVCDECDGTGWKHNRVEGRHACVCMEEAEPYQELVAKLADAHAVLDADPSKIIRNEKDGYPEGRPDRELTLAERISALCKYAADWKQWTAEAEVKLVEAERLLNNWSPEYRKVIAERDAALARAEAAEKEKEKIRDNFQRYVALYDESDRFVNNPDQTKKFRELLVERDDLRRTVEELTNKLSNCTCQNQISNTTPT